MKTLLLMRHAKSSRDDASLSDHDRPLNDRGKRDAPRMGALLAEEGLRPDLIVSSSARRARKTALRVAEALGYDGPIEERDDLYLSPPGVWLAMLQALPDDANCVLCVGHNPTLEGLVWQLGGTRQSMPTAAIAEFLLEGTSWSELHPGPQISLRTIWRPKEIED
jgi:phosphohistidine phosphatase